MPKLLWWFILEFRAAGAIIIKLSVRIIKRRFKLKVQLTDKSSVKVIGKGAMFALSFEC